jgi:hypothetical protein
MMGNPIMRKSTLSGLALWMFSTAPGFAQVYPWCASSGVVAPSPVCNFETQSQCQNFLSGIGGTCLRNPQYVNVQPSPVTSGQAIEPKPASAPPKSAKPAPKRSSSQQ